MQTERTFRIVNADAIAGLRTLPNESIDCCVTSPPYWGLRDYGVTGQIGLELSPELYVSRIVEVFREVRRVLKNTGTLWLNLGDSYATGAGSARIAGGSSFGKLNKIVDSGDFPPCQPNRMPIEGLKPKDLIGIPWRVAFALQSDGWYLRSEIIWSKPNPMPESVTDRPTKAHEHLFLLAKNERYFYDAAAIAEPAIGADRVRADQFGGNKHNGSTSQHSDGSVFTNATTRNKRTVWTINTEAFRDAHFAVMPTALVEPCVMAGCPEGGTVLDPFTGSGTVGVVALRHARSFIGIELKPEYAEMAHKRILNDAPMFNQEQRP